MLYAPHTRDRVATLPIITLGVTLLFSLLLHANVSAAPPSANAPQRSLHLVQRTDIAVAGRPAAVTDERNLYVDGDKLILQGKKAALLVRHDLKTAWVMDGKGHALSMVPTSQLGAMTAAVTKALPNPPPFRTTGESKTIAGLSCRIYRSSLTAIVVEACITQELAALHRFQVLLGTPPEIPGIPLELIITVQEPGKERVTITQRVLRVTTGPVDQKLFVPPTTPSAPPGKR